MAHDDVTGPAVASIPVSRFREGEVDAFFDVDAAAFGARMTRGFEGLVRKVMSLDRVAVSRDGNALVGTAASEHTTLTVPGLGGLPSAMVVGVAVLPSHRRQGRLRALMRYQLDDLRGRGEVAAVLYASEGGIYGRFGYGPATFGSTYVLDKRVARLSPAATERVTGKVRMVRRDEAAAAFPAVYDAYASTRAGEVARSEIDYLSALGEPGGEDLSRRFSVVYEEDARLDGYAAYEVVAMEPPLHEPRRLVLHELCALTPSAYLALWDFLLGVDLTVELAARGRPVDEPVRWALAEPRQLRCTSSADRTWLRLLDVGRCLSGRRYAAAGELVVAVEDAFCPWNAGRYRIAVTEEWGRAEVSRTEHEPHVVTDASTLASLYLGGVPASALAEVGAIRQLSSGAVPLLGRMFANDRAPFCLTPF